MEELLVTKSSSEETAADLVNEEERPISVAHALAIFQQVKEMSPVRFFQQNVSLYVNEVTPLLKKLDIACQWHPEFNNRNLCLLLANCGGGWRNPEYSLPLFDLLNKITDEEKRVSFYSMNYQEKSHHYSERGIGWRDILKKAEARYKAQTVPTQVRWPPACNPIVAAAPLSQYEPRKANRRSCNGSGSRNQRRSGRGNQRGRHSGKSKPLNKPRNPKFVAPDSNSTPDTYANGIPVYQKMINNRMMEWCAKCKRYSTTHNTATHTGRPATVNPDYRPLAAETALKIDLVFSGMLASMSLLQ